MQNQSFQKLGHTRSRVTASHLLHTPDAFVRAPLPGMIKATAIVHTAPAVGAGFMWFTAEMEAGGELGPTSAQRFVYVLEGSVDVQIVDVKIGGSHILAPGGYAYLPQGVAHGVKAKSAARVAVIEKLYEAVDGLPGPGPFFGDEAKVTSQALLGDDDLQVRCLIPDQVEFDFAVNTMEFQPGAALSLVEMHVMEHGLVMLEGGGIYKVDENWYSISVGDFIWMGAFCPQWFAAIGKTPAKYLIYKDWNRSSF